MNFVKSLLLLIDEKVTNTLLYRDYKELLFSRADKLQEKVKNIDIDYFAKNYKSPRFLAYLGLCIHYAKEKEEDNKARSRALKEGGVVAEAADRLQIRIEDARSALGDPSSIEEPPDVIYLDPMFPEGKKSSKSSGKGSGKGKAAVKKDAMLLRMLVGEGADPVQDEELFTLAMQVAKMQVATNQATTARVVVKRSLRAPAIVESPPPQASFKGKSVRVDRYRSSS